MKKKPDLFCEHILESIQDIDIRWKGIAGMRDIIVHEYFGVNLKVVWRTVVHDLPVLKGRIASLLEDLVKNQKLL